MQLSLNKFNDTQRVKLLSSIGFFDIRYEYEFMYKVWDAISKYTWCFKVNFKRDAEEAMHKTYIHVLSHFNPAKGTIEGYVKSLSRVILKVKNREQYYAFLDETVADNEEDLISEVTGDNVYGHKETSKDFTLEVMEKLEREDNPYDTRLKNLILLHPIEFVILSQSLIRRDAKRLNKFSQEFMETSLQLMEEDEEFNDKCRNIYSENKDSFDSFSELESSWKPFDKELYESKVSRRYRFIDTNGNNIEDADSEAYFLSGNISNFSKSNKYIIKVNYIDIVDNIINVFKLSKCNRYRLSLGDECIFITPAGTISKVNPLEEEIEELLQKEIISNILRTLGGKILSIGSENIYLIMSCLNDWELQLFGEVLEIHYEVITDEVLKYSQEDM